MEANLQPNDPVPPLLEELVDALHLLHECRQRGVANLERLLEFIEYTLDEIERHRLGMSSELFITVMTADETNILAPGDDRRALPFRF